METIVTIKLTVEEYETFEKMNKRHNKYLAALQQIADTIHDQGCEQCSRMRLLALQSFHN